FGERGAATAGFAVAVPSSVGPLPIAQPLSESFGAFVSKSQTQHCPQCIAVNGGVEARQAVDFAKTAEIVVGKQPAKRLLAKRHQRLVSRRITKLRQRYQHPVRATPFVVRVGVDYAGCIALREQ